MAWNVEIADNRIYLDVGAYNPRIHPAVKAIDGARWNAHRRMWNYPVSWDVCVQIRETANQFGRKLRIGPTLKEWAAQEKIRQAAIPAVNSKDPVPLDNLPTVNKRLHDALHGYQTVGVAFGARNHEVLIGDQPGLGKTIQVIGAIQELGEKGGAVMVIAPKSAAVATWPREMKRWAPQDRQIVISAHMKPAQRSQAIRDVFEWCEQHPDERYWVFMNVEYLRATAEVDRYQRYVRDAKGNKIIKPGSFTIKEVFDYEWLGLIVDECHLTLAGSTGNKKKWSAQRFGLDMVPVRKDGARIAMSGTPFRGKKENAWGILNWLRPDLYTSYGKWVEKHFVMYDDAWTGNKVSDGKLKDKECFYKDLARVMLRRTKAEVAEHLPAKVYAGTPLYPDSPDSPVAVWLPMTPKQEKAYRQMVRTAGADLEGGTLEANGILAEITRQKQFANALHKINGNGELEATPESNKLEWLAEWLQERGHFDPDDETGKVIVASQFTGFLNMVSTWLDVNTIPHHILTGATSATKRAQIQEEFLAEGGPRLCLLSTKAGGVSLTLDSADDVIILDQTVNPDDQEQVEDRAHRVSRTDHTVTVWYVCSLGTIEEAIAATFNARNIEIKSIIDATRGVDEARSILHYEPKD